MKNQAVAVFGGTFDPVHYGHLRAAAEVAEQLKVSDFRLLPAGQPPHREGTWADAYHRLAMLELALAPYPDLAVDDREVRRDGPSFMVDTLASIRDECRRCAGSALSRSGCGQRSQSLAPAGVRFSIWPTWS